MSANPFRRAQGHRHPEYGAGADEPPLPRGKLISKKKRVKIQTPPQSPEDVPRRLSAGRVSPPPPPTSNDDADADSDSTATADSDLEQALVNTRRNSGSLPPPSDQAASATGAPSNPFARTLATSEAAFGLQRAPQPKGDASHPNGGGVGSRRAAGRPALNVDQFKNILMTGSPAPSPLVGGTQPLVQDSSSNTNGSSLSRQSLFDPRFEISMETPTRASFDEMDSPSESEATDESSSLMSGTERMDDFAPPAPPKQSRPLGFQKGPQTVSFADFDDSIGNRTTTSSAEVSPVETRSGGDARLPVVRRVPSDLNKPLPPPPQGGGSASLPPAPGITTVDEFAQSKKAPPPPPASRRAMQTALGQARARSSSDTTQSSMPDEQSLSQARPVDTTPKPAAPPPPPSRKNKPTSQLPTPATESPPELPSPAPSTDTKNMPPPPPRRNASKTGNVVNRMPSASSSSSVIHKESNAIPSQHILSQHIPPAPPRRRGMNPKRESMEAVPASTTKRPSQDTQRSSSGTYDESGRWNSDLNLQQVAGPVENGNVTGGDSEPAAPNKDILADMSAFQAEIDALRAKAERPG